MAKNKELRMTIRFRMDNPEHRKLYDGLSQRRSTTKQPISTMIMEALNMYLSSNDVFHAGWEKTVRNIVHSEVEKTLQNWVTPSALTSHSVNDLGNEIDGADIIDTDPEDLDNLITELGF